MRSIILSKAQVLPAGSSEQGTIDSPWSRSDFVSEVLELDLESSVEQAAEAPRTESVSHSKAAGCETAYLYC